MADDHNGGARKLVWLEINGRLVPELWFEPYVGTEGQASMIVAQHQIDPSRYDASLDELAAMYPVRESAFDAN